MTIVAAQRPHITLDDEEEGVIVVSDDEEVDEDGVRRQPGDVIPDREKVIEDEKLRDKADIWEGKSRLALLVERDIRDRMSKLTWF